MTNKPKNIGTAAESAIVKVARGYGFTAADRHVQKGRLDEGDIWLLPTGGLRQVMIESKGGHAAESASDAQIEKWLAEVDIEVGNMPRYRAAGQPTSDRRLNLGVIMNVGFLVTKRKGIGPANAGRWWAHTRLGTLDAIRLIDDTYGGATEDRYDIPLRMELTDMLYLLRAGGWE